MWNFIKKYGQDIIMITAGAFMTGLSIYCGITEHNNSKAIANTESEENNNG